MLVDFMILGAQKAGTTSLFDILNAQPGFSGCRPKEPHFFSQCKDWRAELTRYEAMFPVKEGARYFEGSTSYTLSPEHNPCVWRDLYDYNSALKFIYMIRNPLDRIVSAYMMHYEQGYIDKDLQRAVLEHRTYVDASRYYSQIEPYIRTFGRERVHFIEFEEFTRSATSVMSSLSQFLGAPLTGPFDVHSNPSIGSRRRHHKFDRPSPLHRALRRLLPKVWGRIAGNSARRFSERPPMSPRLRETVVALLEPDIQALERLLGKDLCAWRAPSA